MPCNWNRALVLPVCLLLQGCAQTSPVTVTVTEFALGTMVDITVVAPDSATAYQGIRRAAAELQHIGFDFWEGEPNGALGLLNSDRHTDNQELIALIDRALALSRITEGAFDIRIGQIIEAYGFVTKLNYAIIDSVRLDSLIRSAGALKISSTNSVLHLTGSAATLTLGGIAKGYAVDRAVDILVEAGCQAGVVNAGGDLRVWGGTSTRPWLIAIEDPQTGAVLQWLELQDGALATSGDYRTSFMSGNTLVHHIIDPGSGQSATPKHSSSVYAPDCITADALATAFFVLDEVAIRALVAQMDRIGVFQLRPDYSSWHDGYMDRIIPN